MQRVLSVFMTTVFLLVISQQAVVVVHFKLNQKIIAEQFCVNQDKPELQCNGKCYLAKELQETNKKPESEDIKTKSVDLIFTVNETVGLAIPKFVKYQQKILYLEWGYTVPYLEIIKPPPNGKLTLNSKLIV